MPQGNPDWTRDEHILALDLYLRHGPLSKDHPKVVELSRTLNRLPIHDRTLVGEDFRNSNGVYMKLNNFRRLDPEYEGVGLAHGSKGEEEVWNEFVDDRQRLSAVASRIREAADDDEVRCAVEEYPEEEEEVEAEEGRVLYRLHRIRERDKSLVRKKKRSVLKKMGRLQCEVCDFDFEERYGVLGDGFIECHHSTPLAEQPSGQKTKLKDLVLLCSNCHRMIHRRGSMSTDDLRKIVRGLRTSTSRNSPTRQD